MAFATRLVRPFRFASTATSSSTKSFLPSVSMLIERHNLEAAIVSKIPASGPKNNLLKGDILKFLKEGGSLQDIDEIISNEKYFQLQVGSLENEWLIALKKSNQLAYLGVLFKRLSSAECTIAKISRNGEVLRSVDLKSETNTSKPFDRIRSGSFR